MSWLVQLHYAKKQYLMLKWSIFLCLLVFMQLAEAQTAFDALRYSTFDVTATARNMGVGSSISGVGADFSSLSTNPAGLGSFRFSEILVSPAYNFARAKALLENGESSSVKETGNQFLFSAVGAIFVGHPMRGNWSNFNFAIGLNQTANFNQEFNFDGRSIGSITDRFLEQANAGQFFDFESDIAAQADAIFDLDNSGIWSSDFEFFPDVLVPKKQSVTRRGSVQELLISIGGNFKERFLIGASVGLPFLNYSETKSYEESDPDGEIDIFENLTFREDLTTTGVGINAKLGLIIFLTNKIRVGAAVHTPTGLDLEDTFTTNMDYVFNDPVNGIIAGRGVSPNGQFSYRLNTPWRFIGGAGFIIGQSGFISTELEWVNFGKANFNLTANSTNPDDATFETELNGQITNRFNSGINWRVGGEIVAEPFRLRAGIGLGFQAEADKSGINQFYSTGAGYRKGRFFADIAYRLSFIKENYIPYLTSIAPQQSVNVDYTDQRLLTTIGFKF